jgi:hypothetical protein
MYYSHTSHIDRCVTAGGRRYMYRAQGEKNAIFSFNTQGTNFIGG